MNEETYWQKLIDSRESPNHVVVNSTHYMIGPEDSTPRRWRGFGGDRYVIQFSDSRRVTSTNLWCQGTIPAQFREQLPDNAEFIRETSK